MSFFDKVFQIILNEEHLQGDKKHAKNIHSRPIIRVNENFIIDVGECERFGFIIKSRDSMVDINAGGLNINDGDQIDIKTISDMDKFIEDYKLMSLAKKEEKIEKKVVKRRLTIDECITILEGRIAEEEEEESDDSNYRDKDKEIREELDKIRKQSKSQKIRKKFLIRVLLYMKNKKDLWGVVTMERNLNREIGGYVIDYKLQKKLMNIRTRKNKKKRELERENKMKRLMNLSRFCGKVLIARSVLKKLSKLLGRKVAMMLLRKMARGNRLNAKNINKLIKRLVAAKRRKKKQVEKIKKQYSFLAQSKERRKAMGAVNRISERKKKSLIRQM
jgi:hypothetical protein